MLSIYFIPRPDCYDVAYVSSIEGEIIWKSIIGDFIHKYINNEWGWEGLTMADPSGWMHQDGSLQHGFALH